MVRIIVVLLIKRMASVPRHPFWIKILEQIQEYAVQKDDFTFPSLSFQKDFRPELVTGPIRLYNAYNSYVNNELGLESSSSVTILPSGTTLYNIITVEYIYPFNWDDHAKRDYCLAFSPDFDANICKESVLTRKSISITYWSHSWEDKNKKVKF